MSFPCTKPVHSLLLISFPHQLLHALSALKHYRIREGIPEQAPTIIFAWSFQSSEHEQNSPFRIFLDSVLCEFPFVTLVFPTLHERRYELSPFRTLIHRVGWVRSRLHAFSVDAIFFAHDASADRTAQVLMQSFLDANTICFGDPPGFLHPQFHSQHQGNPIKRFIWRSRTRGLTSLRSPTISIVTIGFDENISASHGDVLVLPRSLVVKTLADIQRGLDKIKHDLRVDYNNQEENAGCPNILLISNFSESALTSRENELALYIDICKQFVTKGAKIIIKPHFGTSPKFINKLTKLLSVYRPEIFPTISAQIPIEFFPELVKRCNIISVSSSSALLSYLFEKQISHALTADRIKKYFKVDRVTYMLEANQAIESSLCTAINRPQDAA